MEPLVNITTAEILDALQSASSQQERPERAVTMAELREHTGWGEKRAYGNVKAMVAAGKIRVVEIWQPNLIGRVVPKAGYQLV